MDRKTRRSSLTHGQSDNSGCEACGGRRHVWNESKKVWSPCECLLARRTANRLSDAGIPKVFTGGSIEDLLGGLSRSARKNIKKAMRQPVGESILVAPDEDPALVDRCGFILLRSAIERGSYGLFMNLMQIIEGEFNRAGNSERDFMDVECLLLTIGYEREHSWNRSTLEMVLRHRAMNQLKTIVVSAVPFEDIAQRYGSLFISRVLKGFYRISV